MKKNPKCDNPKCKDGYEFFAERPEGGTFDIRCMLCYTLDREDQKEIENKTNVGSSSTSHKSKTEQKALRPKKGKAK